MEEHFPVPKDLMPYVRAYESLGDTVTISDPSDSLVFINSAGEELYGYARGELVGRPLSRILPAGDRFVGAEMLQSSSSEKWEGEVTRARKSGEEFPAQLTVTLLRNDDGVVIGTVGIVRDLTETRRLADENAVLAEVGRIIGSTLDIDDVYERFASEVGKLIPFDRLGIGISDSAREYVTLAYVSDFQVVAGRKRGDRLAREGTLAQQVVQRTSTVLIQDVTREHLEVHVPGLLPNFDKGIRSFLGLPLMHHDRLVGVLQIFSKQISAYTERHVTLAERVGSQIAGAVANSLLYAQLQDAESEQRRLADENAVLAEVGRIISSSLDIDEVYGAFSELVAQLIPADRIVVTVADRERPVLHYAYTWGQDVPGRSQGDEYPVSGTLTEEVMRTRSPVLVQMKDIDPLLERFPGLLHHLDSGLLSFIVVPLVSRDQVIGALHIRTTEPNAFAQRDLDLAERIGAQVAGVIANAQLYAEQTRVEESVRESERQFRSLYDNTPVMMHAIDREGRLVNVNQQWLDTLGYERTEVIGRRSTEFLSDASRRYATEVALPQFWKIGSARDVEFEMVKKNGEVIDVLLSSLAERDESGEVTQSLAFLVDVTERKRADEEIRRLALAVDTTGEAVIIVGMDTQMVFVNRAAETMCGYRTGEMLGMSLFRVHAESSETTTAQEIFEATMSEGAWTGEILFQKKTGGEFPVRLSTALMKDEQQRPSGMVGIATDVSERRQLEEEFLQAQKMESVGRLAGGVAHDFNNLLTAIINFTYLAATRIAKRGAASDYLQEVQNAAESATSLTSQLLAFSRRQVIEPRVLSLNDIIMDTHRMLRRLIGEDIELVTLQEPQLELVKVDPGQIEQVLINLAVNARDAMPEGGKLVVETANGNLDKEFARLHPETTAGEYIMLTVSDNGIGMTKEVQTHIFEPFFTTKEVTRGTGLGLSTCYGIVRQNGGHIEVQSEPEQGTTFRIYLPRVEGAIDTLPLHDETGYVPSGSETVLLVEDEPLVRKVAVEMLRAQGYDVLEAANGTDAMRVATEHADEAIHLLLTDVVMPFMGGAQLAEQFREVHPKAKVLYMSGYVDDTVVHERVLEERGAFLQKPFTAPLFARRVRETLDRDLSRV